MQAPLISIYEDRQIKLELTDSQARDILALKDLWGSQNLILQTDGTLLMKKYVGYIARNKTRIQILPKLYAKSFLDDKEKEEQESVKLLFRLLCFSGFLNIKEIPDPQKINVYGNDILEIFISIFVLRFIKVFSRNVHRKYESFEGNMQFIKGKIIFQEHINKNLYQRHLHYCKYEEFTVDTLLNKILKTIMLYLLYKTQNNENKKNLKIALNFLEDVHTVELTSHTFDRVRFNRLNQDYKPIFQMAKLFYYNLQPGNNTGDKDTFTFLVPLNLLFEYFIFKLLESSETINKNGYTVKYQGPKAHLAFQNGNRVFGLEPDITLIKDEQILCILDVKYKDIGSLIPSDVYQVLAYGVHYNCSSLFLVYPRFKSDTVSSPTIYEIPTATGNVSLKMIQVDVLEPDISKIQRALEKCIYG